MMQFWFSLLLNTIVVVIGQNQLFPLLDLFRPLLAPARVTSGQSRQSSLIADSRLRKCCGHLKKADRNCIRNYCSFDALSQDKALFFMATCAPLGPTVGQMWDCASSRKDHQRCCRSSGVSPNCMVYCDTTHGVPTDPGKYLQCLPYFNPIRNCFKSYLGKHPNLYGDT